MNLHPPEHECGQCHLEHLCRVLGQIVAGFVEQLGVEEIAGIRTHVAHHLNDAITEGLVLGNWATSQEGAVE